ncbi:hypothetical protein dsx2_1876 [Desulfovibrio sp. X2]|uniref:hypothetical protein n=1 Tax=Desulfovibrio sp. X2 TaxID=941449 RepID=UPI0003589F2A|nr:hypothetical protein [Desulfovibrio sp. X2]EPR44132.1 hypothetical protein dsx2_1876 [Desulfovibrio sp. X2]
MTRDKTLGRTRRIAWNGASLDVPQEWDALAMGRGELRLGPPGDAEISLKWKPIAGRLSPQKHLKRVIAAFARGGEATEEDWLRGQGDAIRTRFETVLPYAWSSGGEKGLGAVVHDQASGLAALFQARTRDAAKAGQWLASLRLPAPNEAREFTVFDISARVPPAFALQSFSFKPGHFTLRFAARRAELVLERLGPAAVLLERTDLTTLASARWPEMTRKALAQRFDHPNGPGFCWDTAPVGQAGRLLARLARTRGFSRLAVWREEGANRLLAVGLSDRRPLDADLFDALCRFYATLQTRDAPDDGGRNGDDARGG